MARRVEEDEGYWPGFVDALSTIVMVVTFLLIILGVAIFAISTQVAKAVKDNQAAAAEAKAEIAESQQQVQEQSAQAQAAMQAAMEAQQAANTAADQIEALQQAGQSEASRLAAELALERTESQQIAEELRATSQTIVEQAQQLAIQQRAAAALAAAATASKQEVEQVTTALAQTQEALQNKQQEVSQLTQSVATLSEAAAAKVRQDQAVQADNAMRISSSAVMIEPAEIAVQAEQLDRQIGEVEVTSSREVLTIRFAENAVDLTEQAATQAQTFIDTNRSVLDQHVISLWSFYDGSSLSVTQEKRTAYFRLLAVRNVLLTAGFDAANIDISVRVADNPSDIDSVQTFLQSQAGDADQ